MSLGLAIWIFGNLTLAVIPVLLAKALVHVLRSPQGKSRGSFAVGALLALWLVFLPNSCYLLTEWRHYLNTVHNQAAFYAIYHENRYPSLPTISFVLLTLFYTCYSGAGLVAFAAAVRPIDRAARQCFGGKAAILRFAICVASSIGVYLGLVERLNSWDILHLTVIAVILRTVSGLPFHPLSLACVLCFALVLCGAYCVFDLTMDGLEMRRHNRQLA